MWFIIIIFTLLFAVVEGAQLVKNRSGMEIICSCFILLLGIAYGADFALKTFVLVNPNIVTEKLFPPANALLQYFQLPII